MNVLSLFDGISCARVALDRANLPVKTYSACEIDPHAIQVSAKNYPDIVRLGDVRSLTECPTPVDLLIGGSPCQDLSIAKKGRQGLAGNRSSLFWEYVRIKDLVKPRWFILENVASMPKADRDTITQALGVEPVLLNASLVSAQTRKRLFWTNLPVTPPTDRGIRLKDILQPDTDIDASFWVKGTFTPTAQTGRNETKKMGYVGENDHQAKRAYDASGKLPALNVVCNSLVKVGYIGEGEQYGQGGQAHRVYSENGKTPTLSSFAPLVVNTETLRIRKLTPVECERLQGLPDGYTDGVAKTHRYKCLGNAFHVDIIAHILSALHS